NLHRAIVIKIAKSRAARRMQFAECRSGLLGNVTKLAVFQVLIQNRAVPVMNVDVQFIHFGEGMTVDQEEILPAVVVEVEKAGSPSDVASILAQTGIQRHVIEIAPAAIAVERLKLV